MDLASDRSVCAEFADDLGTLAAGALTGRERAALLVHVEHCPHCSVELESLSASADALLHLYPELAPDEGFTDRVMARIREEQRSSRRRPRMRSALAAAAVVALLGLAGGLTATFVPRGQSAPSNLATATLQSSSGPRGTVWLTGNRLLMTFEDRGASGPVTCRVSLADGSSRVVGQFPLRGGYGTWKVHLPVAPSSIRTVTVVDDHGTTLASARLS